MKRIASLLAALILFACLEGSYSQDEDLDSSDVEDFEVERAFLLTRKSIVEKDVVIGRNTTVQIEVHNAGTSSALDVVVEDVAWPKDQFKPAGGSLRADFPRILAGSTVKYSYSIIPASDGFIIAHPAVTKYRDMPDADTIQVSKSSMPHVYVLTAGQKYLRSALTVGAYLTLGSMRTVTEWRNVLIVVALIAIGGAGYYSYKSVTEAQKRSQYQKALEEVNKMK